MGLIEYCCFKYGQQRAIAKAAAAAAAVGTTSANNAVAGDNSASIEINSHPPRRSQTVNSIQTNGGGGGIYNNQQINTSTSNYTRVIPLAAANLISNKPQLLVNRPPHQQHLTDELSEKFSRIGSFESVLNRNAAIQGKVSSTI